MDIITCYCKCIAKNIRLLFFFFVVACLLLFSPHWPSNASKPNRVFSMTLIFMRIFATNWWTAFVYNCSNEAKQSKASKRLKWLKTNLADPASYTFHYYCWANIEPNALWLKKKSCAKTVRTRIFQHCDREFISSTNEFNDEMRKSKSTLTKPFNNNLNGSWTKQQQ